MLNQRGTKRVLKEILDYKKQRETLGYGLSFSEKNLGIIYFIIRDLEEEYKEGEYIFRISLPDDYPFRPPVVSSLTPSGRFDPGKSICLSISHFHSESWSPLITMEKLIYSIISTFGDNDISGMGMISTTSEVKQQLARQSRDYNQTNFADILSMEK
jgi:ubiquitin-protein ligase